MEQLLKQTEIEKIQSTFKTHPLRLTCYKVFTPRMTRLNGLRISQEDVFYESARLLDLLLSKPEINQHQVDSLWILLLNDIRKWKVDATDYDKQIVANTIFHLVRATLAQHADSHFSEFVCDMLGHTIERNQDGLDEQEYKEFLQRLIGKSPELSEWINLYDGENEWLSDQIEATIASRSDRIAEDDFTPLGTTFSKTSLLTNTMLDVMGQRLSVADKLMASPDDWRKLFSGIDQKFTLTWKGTDGELRDLFKMLTSKPQYAKPHRGYQEIVKSHFVDENGRWFKNLHGAKSIDGFRPILDDCMFLLQHMTDNMTDIMKQLISENEDALYDAGYFDETQAAKQAGLRIQNKRR